MAGTVLRRLFGIISIIIFTTFLGAGGFGAYMLLLGAVTIMSVIAAMGLAPGTMRFVVQKRTEGQADQVAGLVRTASWVGFASSVVVVLVGWAAAGPIVARIFHQPEQVGLLRWMMLAVPASVLCSLWLHATMGFHRMEETFWISDLFGPSTRIGFFLVLILGGFSLGAAVGAYIGAAVASAVLALRALRRLVPPGPARPKPGEVWTLLSFSLPLLGAGAVGMIMEWTDTMMLGYFTATSQVGVYNVALRVATLSVMIHLGFSSIFAPISADLLQRNKMESLDQLLKIDNRWVFTLTLPIFVLAMLLSRDILAIFGPELTQGSVALMVLTSALFFNACTGSCGAIIRMSGRTRLAFANNCGAGVLNVLLNLLLIPRLGILGAALATGASIVVVNALRLVQVWWLLKLLPYDRKWVKPVVAGLAGGLAVTGLQKMAPLASPVWNLALSALVFSLCFVGLLLLLRVEREDRLMLRLLRARVFGGV
ncbi:flippase [Nitrospinae bacterium AH_259_B05_G02_I21]|nr:flippase [Nitrospinae bacterium AH_259_B05_G02_I21]MDA2931707.1 flippase [Nitrospinae bacterium AH-259-F20]